MQTNFALTRNYFNSMQWKLELVGISFALCHRPKPITFPPRKSGKRPKLILESYPSLFEKWSQFWKSGKMVKYDILVLKNSGSKSKGPLYDNQCCAHYLIRARGKSIPWIGSRGNYFELQNWVFITELDSEKKGKNQGNMRDVDEDEVTGYAQRMLGYHLAWKPLLMPTLKEISWKSYFNEWNPLINVLADMEVWRGSASINRKSSGNYPFC